MRPSGTTQERCRAWSTPTEPVRRSSVPDGYLFVSRRDFALADGMFEVTDHVGWVATGGVHAASLVTDDQAQATGSFTCGSVDGRAD